MLYSLSQAAHCIIMHVILHTVNRPGDETAIAYMLVLSKIEHFNTYIQRFKISPHVDSRDLLAPATQQAGHMTTEVQWLQDHVIIVHVSDILLGQMFNPTSQIHTTVLSTLHVRTKNTNKGIMS